jgi:hypothetical protein
VVQAVAAAMADFLRAFGARLVYHSKTTTGKHRFVVLADATPVQIRASLNHYLDHPVRLFPMGKGKWLLTMADTAETHAIL